LEAIAFIHDKIGLTHTDLKPENILLKNDKSITILDLEQ
jgi:serine/threonine protein kinase